MLVRTGLDPALAAHVASIRDPLLALLRAQQLGEDLVVRLDWSPAVLAEPARVRHFATVDPVRGVYRTRIEIVQPALAADRAERLNAVVRSLELAELGACRDTFERAVRAGLEPGPLASALTPHTSPEGPVLRAALRQYAVASQENALRTLGGEILRVTSPLELEFALTRASEIDGYLAWLERLALNLEPGEDGTLAYRTLVAPTLAPAHFEELYRTAAAARARCLLAATP